MHHLATLETSKSLFILFVCYEERGIRLLYLLPQRAEQTFLPQASHFSKERYHTLVFSYVSPRLLSDRGKNVIKAIRWDRKPLISFPFISFVVLTGRK